MVTTLQPAHHLLLSYPGLCGGLGRERSEDRSTPLLSLRFLYWPSSTRGPGILRGQDIGGGPSSKMKHCWRCDNDSPVVSRDVLSMRSFDRDGRAMSSVTDMANVNSCVRRQGYGELRHCLLERAKL